MSKIKLVNYVDPTDLEFELIVSHGKGNPSDKLISYFDLISRGMVKKLTNLHSEYQALNDDKYQESMLMLLTNWKKINPCSTSFAYCSQISKNAENHMYNMIVLQFKKDKVSYQYESKGWPLPIILRIL